jgi:uncharacterized protein YyaL (SSP411 family)
MNRLAKEPSLYLRQHAENPVDWHPWGEEAWAKARAEDKPVLVSIGYSACHWCHVMAHECFEDAYIADLMNRHFVCIKVDREERPDVDQIYMEAVQMITQHGGWPLNAFCLPDGRPFFGGTYFPPTDNDRGIVPWPQLLMRVADFYGKQKAELMENAHNIVHNLQHANTPQGASGQPLANRALLQAAQNIAARHDETWGGFGGAPKFPPAMALDFLLAVRGTAAADRNPALAKQLDTAANTTARAMAHGGIFDQFGGGFCRYSVDARWLIPHFEKMLYDNGLLLDIYAKLFRRYGNPLYAAVCEETVGWLTREMRHPQGVFYAALDADTDGHEGATYVWTPEQVREALGEKDAAAACLAYGISPGGNFEHGLSNPALAEEDFGKRQALAPARAKLLAARAQRKQPARDEKIVLAWNALVIRGLAEAAWALGRKEWFTLARQAADWLWENLRKEKQGTGSKERRARLQPVYYWGNSNDETRMTKKAGEESEEKSGEVAAGPRGEGFLDDYAFLAEALLALAAYADWAEPPAFAKASAGKGLSAVYVARARALVETVRAHFRDAMETGFFFTADDHEALAVRKKEWWDNALPSGHGALAHVFALLHALTGEAEYAAELTELKKAYAGLAERAPMGVPHALAAFTWDAMGVAVIKVKGPCDWEALRAALAARPYRPVLLVATDDAAQPEGMQLCVGTQCQEATGEAKALAEML